MSLKTELAKPKYQSMTDAEAATELNTDNIEIDIPVLLRGLIVYLLKKNRWLGIESEAVTDALNVKAECNAFMVIMNNSNVTDLDLTDGIVQTMLLNIKTAGLLDADDQSAILAMGKTKVSWAKLNGGVREGDVMRARKL